MFALFNPSWIKKSCLIHHIDKKIHIDGFTFTRKSQDLGFAVNNAVINNGNKTVNKNRNEFFTNASLLQQRTTTKNNYKEQGLQVLTKTTIDNVSKQLTKTTIDNVSKQQQQQHRQWGQYLQ